MSNHSTIKKPSFSLELVLDDFNKRVRVESFRGNVMDLVMYLHETVSASMYEKVIVQARSSQWEELMKQGFELEGHLRGFFNGSDGFVMSYYYNDERRTSSHWSVEQEILQNVQRKHIKPIKRDLPLQYQMRKATVDDAEALAHLYKAVFPVYPTPMNEVKYIRKIIESGNVFCVTEYEGEVVSSASADLNKLLHHAELTDCATLPEHRSHGLMKHLLIKLEEELLSMGFYCAFSLARARSFGMNDAFYQLGYSYGGRLTNNCYIFEDLEDMNVWVKDLSK
ncbi:putative beta-lysine N-acetyltransferase [Alkalihalophilus lindianensis]|uniref:Beta-lysine N-acetyltransferase n=1 Tax=Alkalihalophilus lindianensis TaxID=1630542 RepID=A0ABU3X702_9BACI|nr:putative beta-lysine N-acetyltransferase [Alkalihalophilus lindianensis]MDV2683665.1 putative beta-lysine N-acetyltransferase [Alkalihalophilus lindianensis]